ncbi:hypothetical protein FNV43_RR08238 [Rhamnella rubrinervis]|uniref:Uncharacterized protein n=1 Tax=Rhamnella rubrinervis TaxID=2594499 RepID=A0A8K0HGU5_9ROSA|nr:hypothetical protein FNV43_RR08238 [Rhamnella rubrinervis]
MGKTPPASQVLRRGQSSYGLQEGDSSRSAFVEEGRNNRVAVGVNSSLWGFPLVSVKAQYHLLMFTKTVARIGGCARMNICGQSLLTATSTKIRRIPSSKPRGLTDAVENRH